MRQIKGAQARVGIILPSGIATDYYNQDYFNAIVEEHELVSLYDFENREKLFSEVDSRMKFCLLTLTGANAPAQEIDFAFFLLNTDHLMDEERHFTLSKEELRRINPNTGTCPTFRSKRDAELTRKLYLAAPVLVNEKSEENKWKIHYRQGLFHSSSDAESFNPNTRKKLEAQGSILRGNNFYSNGERKYLRFYEGRMISQFDHRYSGYEKVSARAGSNLPKTTVQEHQDMNFIVLPWFWTLQEVVTKKWGMWPHGWLIGFRDIARSTDERTSIFSILPHVACSDQFGLVFPVIESPVTACLLANLNSFVLDYVARQKVGGIHLKKYLLYQFPVLPPDRYTPAHLTFIVPRVLELTYTAWDIVAFADDVWREADEGLRAAIEGQWQANVAATGGGHAQAVAPEWVERATDGFPDAPFMWDEGRRIQLRAELDGLYGHLYGLTRDELAYILDTFPIVRRKDEAKYGEYRTKRMVLEAYDGLVGSGVLAVGLQS